MVDAHCVRDEGGFTVLWLVVAFHWVRDRVRARVYTIESVCQPMLSKKWEVTLYEMAVEVPLRTSNPNPYLVRNTGRIGP